MLTRITLRDKDWPGGSVCGISDNQSRDAGLGEMTFENLACGFRMVGSRLSASRVDGNVQRKAVGSSILLLGLTWTSSSKLGGPSDLTACD